MSRSALGFHYFVAGVTGKPGASERKKAHREGCCPFALRRFHGSSQATVNGSYRKGVEASVGTPGECIPGSREVKRGWLSLHQGASRCLFTKESAKDQHER